MVGRPYYCITALALEGDKIIPLSRASQLNELRQAIVFRSGGLCASVRVAPYLGRSLSRASRSGGSCCSWVRHKLPSSKVIEIRRTPVLAGCQVQNSEGKGHTFESCLVHQHT